MMPRLPVALTLAVAAASAPLAGCKRAEPGASPVHKNEAPALTADRGALAGSWLERVALDPTALVGLAQSSPDGWRKYFTGDPAGALELFEADREKNVQARIGAGRAALDLALAHAQLARIAHSVTPALLAAQASRPDAEHSTGWRAFVQLRFAPDEAARAAAAAVPADAPPAPWIAAVAPEAATPFAALLRGEAAGVDADAPPGATPSYDARLHIKALTAAGKLKEAAARLRKIDHRQADIELSGETTGSLWDPAAADYGARYYAAVAAEAFAGLDGAPRLLLARALVLAGKPDEANAALEPLIAAPPAEVDLAQAIVSGELTAADVQQAAIAERIRILASTGKADAARPLLARLTTATIAGKVRHAWAGSFLGEFDPEAFPEDRSILTRALLDELTKQGEKAKGLGDINDLALADRYVDLVQRQFAAALGRMDRPALAVKMRDAAEDKSSAQAPSARNQLSALAAAAYDNLAIGRPRVALKYLSRMGEALPAAAGPAEMLRDLLSRRAMEDEGGGATTGY